MRKLSVFAVLVLLVVATLGCDDNDSPTAPVVEEPAPVPTVTDTYTGELRLGETSCHVFNAVNPGDSQLMIVSLEPLPTLTVGLGLGIDDGDPETACSFFATDRSVRVGETLLSRLTSTGDHCVCILDVGNIFADQTVIYTLQVEHP